MERADDCRLMFCGRVLVSGARRWPELADVLSRAKFDCCATLKQGVQFIRLLANIAEFVPLVQAVRACRDPTDDELPAYLSLEVGRNGRADRIITGDKHSRALNPSRGREILSAVSDD